MIAKDQDSETETPEGRDASRRFAPGWRGPGNPHAKKVAQLRSALFETVTVDYMRAVAAKLVELSRAGDLLAIKELLERCLGKPVEGDFLERLDALAQVLTREQQR